MSGRQHPWEYMSVLSTSFTQFPDQQLNQRFSDKRKTSTYNCCTGPLARASAPQRAWNIIGTHRRAISGPRLSYTGVFNSGSVWSSVTKVVYGPISTGDESGSGEKADSATLTRTSWREIWGMAQAWWYGVQLASISNWALLSFIIWALHVGTE